MRSELKLFWRRGMAGPVLVRALVGEAELSVREIVPAHEWERECDDLCTNQAIPSELFDTLCRACEACDGMHHWMIYMPDPESEEDVEHPAVQAGHTLGFWRCKHCDAWAGMAEDDDEDAGPPEPRSRHRCGPCGGTGCHADSAGFTGQSCGYCKGTGWVESNLDRFRTPCCNAAPTRETVGPYDYRCMECWTMPVERFTWWQLLYRPAPITFTDQDLAETMEAANLSEQPGETQPPGEDA